MDKFVNNSFLKDDINQQNKSEKPAIVVDPFPPQIIASLYPDSIPETDHNFQQFATETWVEITDTYIYPRMKFRERHMESPEVPFR